MRLEARFLTAAITSNLKEVAACIEAGVNVNAYIRGGCNALHLAAEKGDVPLATTLALSPELNYNAKSDVGLTPLILACLIRKRSFVKFLMMHNVDPNVTDRFGKTAMHYICRMDAIELALDFFKYGTADVNIPDCFGATPLMVALLEANSLHMAKLLLRNRANMRVGPERALPLFLECVTACTTPEDLEKVKFLVLSGADVNMTQRITGKTALHLVALTAFVPLAALLINLGAKPGKTDVSGRKPFEVAKMHGNYTMYKFLKREEARAIKAEEKRKQEAEAFLLQAQSSAAGTSQG